MIENLSTKRIQAQIEQAEFDIEHDITFGLEEYRKWIKEEWLVTLNLELMSRPGWSPQLTTT